MDDLQFTVSRDKWEDAGWEVFLEFVVEGGEVRTLPPVYGDPDGEE